MTETSDLEPTGPRPAEIVWTGVAEVNAFAAACRNLRYVRRTAQDARAAWAAAEQADERHQGLYGTAERLQDAARTFEEARDAVMAAKYATRAARADAYRADMDLARLIRQAYADVRP